MPRKRSSFIWDAANTTKLWVKHGVRPYEVEEAFTDQQAIIAPDTPHSVVEDRYMLLGKSRKHRVLSIIFTIREGRIRPISARTANREEVAVYEEEAGSTKI